MKKIIIIVFIFFTICLYTQKIKVLESLTDKPIEYVLVYNKSKTNSFISDKNGIIDISDFKENETLFFYHVSYSKFKQKKSVILNNKGVVFLNKESEQLDEIVVSVFKSKDKTKRIAEQIAVISKSEIQKLSPQTSADLLANIPGIKIQKTQLGGGSPILRGMESNRVLLVVDGVRLNNAIYRKGHIQNSITISPNLIYKTEVIFGPSSVIYGSDALGGVIHYYTKTPKTSDKTKIKNSFFSRFSSVNNEITNNISTELSFKKWASFTSISYSKFGDLIMGKNRFHGFKNWGKVKYYSKNSPSNFFKNQTLNSNFDIQKNTGFSQTDILQKFYVPLSNKTDLKLNIQYSTSSDIPRFDRLTLYKENHLKFAEWYYGPQKRLLISPQFKIKTNKKILDKVTFTLAYQNIKESRINRKFNSLKKYFRHENVHIYSINSDFSIKTAKNKNLNYGFEIAFNNVNSNSYGKKIKIFNNKIIGYRDIFKVQSRYADGGSTYLSSSLYSDYRQDISKKSTLNTGIRLTNTNLSAKWIDTTFIKLPFNKINIKNTALTATIGYIYKPNIKWQLNTVLSSGFRSPNIDDIGKVREKNGFVTVPNINLKPENAYNSEFSIQKYFNNRKFRVGFNIYYTFLTNYIYREKFKLNNKSKILYDNELETIVSNVNKGIAFINGFTLSYQGKLGEFFDSSGSITYTKGKTLDSNQNMSSIPPLFGNMELNYTNKQLMIGSSFRFNAKKNIINYNLEEGIDNQNQTPIIQPKAKSDINKYYGTPSWSTLSFYARYKINNNFILNMHLNNIFDEHYKEFASGISAPGRDFSLSLTINF